MTTKRKRIVIAAVSVAVALLVVNAALAALNSRE